jgi:spore germination protein GerM
VLAISLLLAGCGFPSQSAPERIADEELPAALRPGATVPVNPVDGSEPVSVWFVSERNLDRRQHFVSRPVSIELLIAELVEGPTEAEQAAGLRSALPDGTVIGATLGRGNVVVELEDAFRDLSPEDQVLAVGQIVLTLTDFRGVGSVSLSIDGEQIAVPVPAGETSDPPLVREQYIELRAA